MKNLIVVSLFALSFAFAQPQTQNRCLGNYEVATDENGVGVLVCVSNGESTPVNESDVLGQNIFIFESSKSTRKFFVLTLGYLPDTNDTNSYLERDILFFYNATAQQWHRMAWPNETQERPLQIYELVVTGMGDQFLSVYTRSKIVLEFQYYSSGTWKFLLDKSVNMTD